MATHFWNGVNLHNWFSSLSARALWSGQENFDGVKVVVVVGGGVGGKQFLIVLIKYEYLQLFVYKCWTLSWNFCIPVLLSGRGALEVVLCWLWVPWQMMVSQFIPYVTWTLHSSSVTRPQLCHLRPPQPPLCDSKCHCDLHSPPETRPQLSCDYLASDSPRPRSVQASGVRSTATVHGKQSGQYVWLLVGCPVVCVLRTLQYCTVYCTLPSLASVTCCRCDHAMTVPPCVCVCLDAQMRSWIVWMHRWGHVLDMDCLDAHMRPWTGHGSWFQALNQNRSVLLLHSIVMPCFYVDFKHQLGKFQKYISGLEPKCPPQLSSSSEKLAKSLQPTLESSSVQTAEPIAKCHTIL